MSTRRSTRATSRSSRAVSPAPSAATTTTPRTRRGAGNEALPAVGLRTSTAYGTNTTAKPARVNGPVVSDQIDTVLQGLLAPTSNPSQNQTQSRAQTPASNDRSFGIENGLFYGARFESSQPSTPTPPDSPNSPFKSPEPPTGPPTGLAAHVAPQDAAGIQTLEKLARQRLQAAGHAEPGFISGALSQVWSLITSTFTFLSSLVSSIFSFEVLPYFTAALVAFVLYQALFSDIDIKDSIGKHFPTPETGTGDHWFKPADAKLINTRIAKLEKAVSEINKKFSKIDTEAIDQLKKILPDLVVVKKDRYAKMIIPDDFWAALQEKIRADDTFMKDRLDDTVDLGKGKGSVTHKGLAKEVEKVAKSAWDRYMKQNENNLKNILDAELGRKFPRLLQENQVATKEEVIELLRNSWDDNSAALQTSLAQLNKKVESASRSIEKLQKNPGTITKDEVTTIATDILKKLIPHAQLEALAKANLMGAAQDSLARPNHFSQATGAVVDPMVTSPTYNFPHSKVWFPTRWMRWAIGNPVPSSPPPEAALTRWEEFGDCWCAPSTNSLGFGPSIGVITGNNIYPDQIVVEHIAASATLQPGAAPREMELVAYLGDLDTYNAVKTVSEGLFLDEVAELEHPYRYVRIATWTYDVAGESVQSFPVQVDTRALGADANKFIVRAKNNWGGEQEVPYTCLYRIKVHGELIPSSGDV